MHLNQFFLLTDDHKRIIDNEKDHDQSDNQKIFSRKAKPDGTEKTKKIQWIANHGIWAFAYEGLRLVARYVQCGPETSQNAYAYQETAQSLEKQEMVGFVFPGMIREQENSSYQNNNNT